MAIKYVWIYCLILESVLVYRGDAWIRPCRDVYQLYTKQAEVGESTTFEICVTSPERPENAYFQYLGICRANEDCFEQKLRWTSWRVDRSNDYRVTVEFFSVEPSDFRSYHLHLIAPSSDPDQSNVLEWVFELRESGTDISPTILSTERPVLTTEAEKEIGVTLTQSTLEPGAHTETSYHWKQSTDISNLPGEVTDMTSLASISPSPSPVGTESPAPSSTQQPPLPPSPSPTLLVLTSSPSFTITNATITTSQVKAPTKLPPRPSPHITTPTIKPKTSTAPSRSTTLGARILQQCLPENPADCPAEWTLIGNSTCISLSLGRTSWSTAKATCESMDTRLPELSEQTITDFQQCVTDFTELQSIWLEDPGIPNFQTCWSYNMTSGQEGEVSCEKNLPFFCSLDVNLYGTGNKVRPKITSFGLHLYTTLDRVGKTTNKSLRLYKQLNLSGETVGNVLLDANVTHIRVTCHAQGLPQPEVVINSTLIGGEKSTSTITSPEVSFLYSKPASLRGALGSVACHARNIYGDDVASTQVVEIGVLLEPRIISFTSPLHQLQRGDTMVLRCETIGFPPPKVRIVQENSDLLVNSSTSGTNFLEYAASNIGCQHSGWYRCEVEDTVVGKIKVIRTHVEVKKCPPTCPKNFHLVHEPNETRIQLSWIPSFNGGAQQSFYLFVNTNGSKWRRFMSAMGSDVTYVWRNVSELSAGTNYSFRIVPFNMYVAGEPDSSTCRKTVHFCTQAQQSKRDRLSDDGPLGNTNVYIAIGVVVAVLVCFSAIAIAWFQMRKGRLRRLRTAFESLSRLISFSESNVEVSMSKTSSSSSVFETNT